MLYIHYTFLSTIKWNLFCSSMKKEVKKEVKEVFLFCFFLTTTLSLSVSLSLPFPLSVFPSNRFRRSVLTNTGSACQSRHVPRDPGGGGGSYAGPIRSFTAEQCTATGWAIPAAEDSDRPPNQLPGWCWAGNEGGAGAHQAAGRWWSSTVTQLTLYHSSYTLMGTNLQNILSSRV